MLCSCIPRFSPRVNFQGTHFPQVISVVDVSDESWVEPTLMAINDENWDGAASNLWK